MKGPPDRYELHMQMMHEAIIQEFSRGLERAARLPQNGYRRKLYFEGVACLGESITLLAAAAAQLVRLAGKDLQG
jgi:hypothetical protein